MTMRGSRWQGVLRGFVVLVLGAVFAPVAVAFQGAGAPGEARESAQAERLGVGDLMALSRPGDDDWETEALYAEASDVLHGLLDAVAEAPRGELDPWCVPGASATALQPDGGEEHALGDLHLRRVRAGSVDADGETVDLGKALEAWIGPLRGAQPPHVAFKVVDVRAGEDGSFTTGLLLTLSGRIEGGPVQQNATWRVGWAPSSEAGAGPRVRHVACLSFEEVRAPGPLFEECTGAVLPRDPDFLRQWSRGGEHWFGRIDALGEWNYFGHNGIAVGDVDGDGLDDLYVAFGTGLPNKLLVRQPDGSVVDRSEAAGVGWLDDTKGVLLFDYDNDGDQDLFCAIGPTVLVSDNDGEGVFTPARSLRAATDAAFYSLAAADFDLDGDLDLYATRYVTTRYGESLPMPFHDARNGPRNHLLRNDYPDGFQDVTDAVGLGQNNDRFSLAASWEDYDQDGDPDLYVANDFGRNNLYRNDGGHFVDVAGEAGAEDMSAGMGASWGDVDLDGDADLLVSNMFSAAGQRVAYQPRFERERDDTAELIQRHALGNSLLLNGGDGKFHDGSAAAGVRMGRWAWGGLLTDFTGDGYPDMAVPNGFLTNALDDDL